MKTNALLSVSFLAMTVAVQAQDLRIGLQDDVDVLDPARSRTFVGEIVFESLCDSLVAVGVDLEPEPELAARWSWNDDQTQLTMALHPDLMFHDGSPIDARAVKANLDRAMTLPDSMRRSELQSVESVDVVDDLSFTITLSQPDPTLLPQLSNRAGMMMSPAVFEGEGAVGLNPVCSGPYMFVEREQNYRIALRKFDDHRNADDYHFERITFYPIPDTTVRLANLRAGDLEMIERLAPSDIPLVRDDPSLQLALVTSVGYQGLTINVGNGARADGPLSGDKRVRQALQLAIDRNVINDVVGAGSFQPAQQPFSEQSPFHDSDLPVIGRDVEAARALLAEAGVERVSFELLFANSTTGQQIAELVQAMVAEVGFDVSLRPVEFASMLQMTQAGEFDVVQTGWSGRYDPDGNLHQFVTCEAGLNFAGFCDETVDRLLNGAKIEADFDARKRMYDEAQAILQDELPIIYVYHQPFPYVLAANIEGFEPNPTGVISLRNVSRRD
ncbi:ABC transporter substrate-binding protein [Aureimonas populi]|uniref:ABC transporter substrate-binding protein n=1 Tax=Aureimonas populi TaxID=1701758 RepID=A0ABW5CKZ5_9HYPH|nr:ABC transporter substrate-binding protein [Aureimonas populi]